MIKRFFDLWSKFVRGNQEDFFIGLNQLEEEIRADERDKVPNKICKSCKYCIEHHYEDEGETPYIKLSCSSRYGLTKDYAINYNDYCSRWVMKEVE